MFGFINKKQHDALVEQNEVLKKEIDDLKRQLELVNEDNIELRNVNDFYLKKYNDSKHIIRNLNNEIPNKSIIPYKCKHCDAVLNYNENLHISFCPDCNATYR